MRDYEHKWIVFRDLSCWRAHQRSLQTNYLYSNYLEVAAWMMPCHRRVGLPRCKPVETISRATVSTSRQEEFSSKLKREIVSVDMVLQNERERPSLVRIHVTAMRSCTRRPHTCDFSMLPYFYNQVLAPPQKAWFCKARLRGCAIFPRNLCQYNT